jgi:hypothetical protein
VNISPIKTQRDYRNVLKEIEGLMIAKRNTPEGDRLDVLVTLVEGVGAEALSNGSSRSSGVRMGCSRATSFPSLAVVTACTRCSIEGAR